MQSRVLALALLAGLSIFFGSATQGSLANVDDVADSSNPARVKQLSKEEVGKLLEKRLNAGMGHSFAQFANMFFVSSRRDLGQSMGLMTSSEKIAKTLLQSPFPAFYKPSLRELLDSISLQTFSQWKYDPSGKYIDKKAKAAHLSPKEMEMAIFEFSESERSKPYELTLAKGWTGSDKGNWTLYSPPGLPVGMDIYEMGSYSADNKDEQEALFKQVPTEIAFEWAKRVQARAQKSDLKTASVGPYEAVYFESMVKSQIKKDVRWRQWVFMVGNRCFFIVSTIFPDSEDKIYPELIEMLKSFHVK